MYKNKDIYVFVRFGGLNVKQQKGYKSNHATYHSPPTTKGFYAMPKIAQEFFLIGSMDKFQPHTVPKRKENMSDEELDSFHTRYKKAINLLRKEFKKTDGYIWHHLEEYTKRAEIIETSGSWVKTTIKAWATAFSKMSLKLRMEKMDDFNGNINMFTGVVGLYSKDHCEVFFDEKV